MAMTLITTNTESGAASSSFTSGIDSTYKLYIFKFIDIDGEGTDPLFQFQGSTDGGSNYGVTKTSTFFTAIHLEDDSATALQYETDTDKYHMAQVTTAQPISRQQGRAVADEAGAGTLWLFNPSNTTYVKHFYSIFNAYGYSNRTHTAYVAGYLNTTSAINAIQFTMTTGDYAGTIKMYGVG